MIARLTGHATEGTGRDDTPLLSVPGSRPLRSNIRMGVPTLSVVVPVLNEAPRLAATLPALRKDLPAGAELIVVDGGSAYNPRLRCTMI